MERRVRLGDVIDDYCTRCRMIMNHGIVGMVGDDVAKVRCNTCQSEHAFKHGRIPKRRRGETDRLFAEVLRGIRGEPDAAEASAGAGDEPEGEAAAEEKPGKKPRVASRTRVARHARTAASRTAALAEPPHEPDEDRDAEDRHADLEEPSGSEMTAAAESGDEADEIAPEAGNTSAPDERDEEGPTHGVRRKLFTIRRHSGGKPPVAGVTTDGSAERAARGQGQQPQGQGRFGGRGGHGGGGRHGHGGHGGQGGGGRQDQQGRWPRRHRRRG
jgi:uncharacterized membrane protein YgcG